MPQQCFARRTDEEYRRTASEFLKSTEKVKASGTQKIPTNFAGVQRAITFWNSALFGTNIFTGRKEAQNALMGNGREPSIH